MAEFKYIVGEMNVMPTVAYLNEIVFIIMSKNSRLHNNYHKYVSGLIRKNQILGFLQILFIT